MLLRWIASVWPRRKGRASERIVLRDDGFDLHRGTVFRGRVVWASVVQIVAFKKDKFTYDLVCMEFQTEFEEGVFAVNEEIVGFWAMTRELKDVFPDSMQNWEDVVVKPAFAPNPTTIYCRPIPG